MPDGIVRPGRSSEASSVAHIQQEAWRASYATLVPAEVLDTLESAEAVAAWESALGARDEHAAVLVAVEDDQVAGFTAFGPGADPDTGPQDVELVTIAVAPERQGHGHGSRLLHAAMQTAADSGADRAYTWLPADDEAGRNFLIAAGWLPDGAARTLDLRGDGAVLLEQVRLHTSVV